MRERLHVQLRVPAPDTPLSVATCVVIAWVSAFLTGGAAGWLLHEWLQCPC